jgi:hypothetical protein
LNDLLITIRAFDIGIRQTPSDNGRKYNMHLYGRFEMTFTQMKSLVSFYLFDEFDRFGTVLVNRSLITGIYREMADVIGHHPKRIRVHE